MGQSIPICQLAATWADSLPDRWLPAPRDKLGSDKVGSDKVVWGRVDLDRVAASDKVALDRAAALDKDRD